MTAGGSINNNNYSNTDGDNNVGNSNIFDGNYGHDVDDNDSDDGIKNFVPTRFDLTGLRQFSSALGCARLHALRFRNLAFSCV